MRQPASTAEHAKIKKVLVLTGAALALGVLAAIDSSTTEIRIGALAVAPLLLIAYYGGVRLAIVVSLIAAPVFAFFDRDSVHNGFVDYWGLSVDAISLAVAFVAIVLLVNAMQRSRRRHSALALEYERVRRLAERDYLTALPNRATFIERLDGLLSMAAIEPRSHGVLFCDLDGFKAINDANGHRIGDLLLAAIAERLRLALRGNDVVGRIGGDEFAVLVENARDRTEIATVANKLDLALLQPFAIEDRELRVHISTGFALFPADGQTADELLAVADAQMYRAKRARQTLSGVPAVDPSRAVS